MLSSFSKIIKVGPTLLAPHSWVLGQICVGRHVFRPLEQTLNQNMVSCSQNNHNSIAPMGSQLDKTLDDFFPFSSLRRKNQHYKASHQEGSALSCLCPVVSVPCFEQNTLTIKHSWEPKSNNNSLRCLGDTLDQQLKERCPTFGGGFQFVFLANYSTYRETSAKLSHMKISEASDQQILIRLFQTFLYLISFLPPLHPLYSLMFLFISVFLLFQCCESVLYDGSQIL